MFNEGSPHGLTNTVIDVLGVPTWVSYLAAEKRRSNQKEDLIVLVIPGNPGPIGFYETFITSLYECSDKNFSIYGISHAGK